LPTPASPTAAPAHPQAVLAGRPTRPHTRPMTAADTSRDLPQRLRHNPRRTPIAQPPVNSRFGTAAADTAAGGCLPLPGADPPVVDGG
jgi:hypothetical protein